MYCLIRSHQEVKDGFARNHDNCYTIFSASNQEIFFRILFNFFSSKQNYNAAFINVDENLAKKLYVFNINDSSFIIKEEENLEL